MKPIFTIHAGEYLLGSHIEESFRDVKVWVPCKDVGVDLLLTNKQNKKSVSLQVKFSKDYLEPRHFNSVELEKLMAAGWWKHDISKIKKTSADFWILVLYCQKKRNIQNIIIQPQDLLKRLQMIHGNAKNLQSYLQITGEGKCWETRGLNKDEKNKVINKQYTNKIRNFSEYLENWDPILRRLRG